MVRTFRSSRITTLNRRTSEPVSIGRLRLSNSATVIKVKFGSLKHFYTYKKLILVIDLYPVIVGLKENRGTSCVLVLHVGNKVTTCVCARRYLSWFCFHIMHELMKTFWKLAKNLRDNAWSAYSRIQDYAFVLNYITCLNNLAYRSAWVGKTNVIKCQCQTGRR